MDKPKRYSHMSAGRVHVEHPWYDAAEIDKWLRERDAKTLDVLREAREQIPSPIQVLQKDGTIQTRNHPTLQRIDAFITQLEEA